MSGTPVSLDPLQEPLRLRYPQVPQVLGVLHPQGLQSEILLKLLSDMDSYCLMAFRGTLAFSLHPTAQWPPLCSPWRRACRCANV